MPILFFFSGHGSLSSLDPLDPRGHRGEISTWDEHIYDYELEEWLGNLNTNNIAVILDSCHSGAFIEKMYLFSIDAKFEDDLNKGIISDDLKDKFESEGFPLSKDAMVTKEKENVWVITDLNYIIEGNHIKFTVRKEDETLNIYYEILNKDGYVVLTACKADESSKANHPHFVDNGLVPFYIIQGLWGAADINNDRKISAVELFKFMEPRVLEVSTHYPYPPHPQISNNAYDGDLNILVMQPPSKIQKRINDAKPGDEIKVGSGTYQEHLIIKKPLTLIGEDATIDGGDNSGCIFVKSDNVNISGFILKNGNFGIYLDYHDNHRITNNIVSGNINGIYLFLSNKNTITDNRVSNNKGHGVYLYSSYKNTITDNECSNNKDAIELLASNENTVANNNISFHSDDGICIYESNSNEIINNDISNNAGMGIALSYSNDNSIYHNNLKDNDIQAIEVASTNLWDNDYPSGGNHWGDYGEKYKEEYNEDPEDKKCGQNQDQACDGDGIWDKPYKWIEGDAGAKDNYPLVEPWSNRVNAEFVTNGWPDCCSVSDETYKPGDIVRASCRVKNTGSAQARFVVVFNVIAPDGTIYSKTSRYETILPGRRHTFLADMDDLLLRIPVDANTGF